MLYSAAVGSVPSPFDCYLANRGLKTLHLRMREHEKNAIAVAKHLEKSPFVKQVFYPGRYWPHVNESSSDPERVLLLVVLAVHS